MSGPNVASNNQPPGTVSAMNVLSELNSEFVKSWYDVAWTNLNRSNVMMYFTQRSNPFYDRRSNNELLRHPHNKPIELLKTMVGLEYDLIYEEPPILFVVQKRRRQSPTHVTPIANYYIIAGVVYRAPDLNRILSSRIATACDYLNEAFQDLSCSVAEENQSSDSNLNIASHNQTSVGGIRSISSEVEKLEERSRLITSFQTYRVDHLLNIMAQTYTPSSEAAVKTEIKEPTDLMGPPENKRGRRDSPSRS